MKPCSYFLPKSYLNELEVDDENEPLVKCCAPVFSHKFDNVHHFRSDHLYKITMADSGRGISFVMKEIEEESTSVFFTEYQFHDNTMVLSKQSILCIEHSYNYKVYDSDKGVYFFFDLLHVAKHCTRIYITYAMVGDNNDCTVRKSIVLEYNQFFNRYCCGCSVKENMLVVVTGNRPSFTEQVSYMDLLSYEVFTHSSSVRIKHNLRRNLTEVVQLNRSLTSNGNEIKPLQPNYVNIYYTLDGLQSNYVNIIYSTFDGKKLILVCSNQYSGIVYSISDDAFGPVFNFKQYNMTVHWTDFGCSDSTLKFNLGDCIDEYFYVYHKDYGDLLIICNQEGIIRVVRENNLQMQLLDEKTILLSDFGCSDERFKFLHVDCFDDILIFVSASDCNELLVISFFQKSILCKYVPQLWYEPFVDIIDVTTNWSGEEVFVFLCRADCEFELHILYLKKKKEPCLKELSKMAVLQTYSVKDLMEMKLPKNLREEMKLL